MCAKCNFVIVLSLIAAMLSASTGCDAQVSEKTLHQKLGWKAEGFFADPKVIELCRAIEALIAGGVDVNAKGKGNMTPLMWAFPDEKLPRFEMLLRAGADPNVYITSDLGVPNGFTKGDSVTHMACRTCSDLKKWRDPMISRAGKRRCEKNKRQPIKRHGVPGGRRKRRLANRKWKKRPNNAANCPFAFQEIAK